MTIGAMLLDNSTIVQAAAKLRQDGSDYFLPSHRALFRAILALHNNGRKVDPITLQEELRSAGNLEACGGAAYVAATFDGLPRFSDITNYLRIVKGKAAQRRIISTAYQAMQAAFDGEDDPSELLAQVRRQFDAIEDPNLQTAWATAEKAIGAYFDYVDGRLESGKKLDGLATGYDSLDEELGGLPQGTLSLVAARPGMGKTAFLAGIAENAPQALENSDLLVAFFTCEMPTEQVIQRMIASRAYVPVRALRNLSAFRNPMQFQRIQEATSWVSELPIVFDDSPGLSPARFKAEVRKLQRENPKKRILALVDYLQLMEPDERRGMSAYDRASYVSSGLMKATKELRVTTIAAAQLRRPPAGQQKSKPTMADVRDSGQIEQDAAVILFPFRPSYYEQQEHYEPRTAVETDASIIVGKGRFSGFSEVAMHFDPKTTRYVVPPNQVSYGGTNDQYDSND